MRDFPNPAPYIPPGTASGAAAIVGHQTHFAAPSRREQGNGGENGGEKDEGEEEGTKVDDGGHGQGRRMIGGISRRII